MEPQDKNVVNAASDQNPNPNVEGSGKKKGLPKKVKKLSKTSGKKVVKKITKTKNVESVKNPQIQEQIPEQAEAHLQPVEAPPQFLPSEEAYEKELPVKNLEQQVNKEYKLKDVVNATKTTMHFLKSLSTTVVKPAIIQKVTTRKPIIAPVDYRTPVNFYEGQPLNQEDLIIQNFFKNTSPLTEATSKDVSDSYLFNGTNYKSDYLSQSVPASQTYNYNLGGSYDYGSNSYSNYNNYDNYNNYNNYTNYTNDYNYNNNYDYSNNYNYLSQSVQYPSTTPNLVQAEETTTTTTDTNFVRPQIEKVQVTDSGPKTEKKVVKKKFIKKSGKKKRKIVKNIDNVKKNLAQEENPVPVQNTAEEGKKGEDDDDGDMPRDSVRK